jgi:beta-mannosidase
MTTLPPGSVIGNTPVVWLHEGWRLARSSPGSCADPDSLARAGADWFDARVPGTVASSIHTDLDTPGPYDADDWWYRLRFNAGSSPRSYLRFYGLATLAEVWLNGTPILSSRNMFMSHRVDVTRLLRDTNELVIVFRSLDAQLREKRARPRWKTALISQQNLRWFRTTLLGRIPGWTPQIAPVGPWGPIALERAEELEVETLRIDARAESGEGRVKFDAAIEALDERPIDEARLRIGDDVYALSVIRNAITGDIRIPDAALWFPHTHGEPRLHSCRLELRRGDAWLDLDCGAIGFKELALDQTGGNVRFRVNGIPVFCRGACWTPLDILALRADAGALRKALETARDAGINMLRVGGTMVYESDDFYRLCDELGILVWQDFMFANMDYPFGDAQFRETAEAEVTQQLDRLHRHVSIAAYCGGSEIAQQAAMLGLPAEQWCNEFFSATLARRCADHHGAIPYFPSSPWGGALPFHVGTGISHYYGVGAYRRPLADVKSAHVKFAAECLGLSNVPDASTMELVLDGALPPPHHPRWKARVPRDGGAGYDFEDVRDHYLAALFDQDPVALRSRDPERYYAISRVVSGEVMRRVFAEWRAPRSECGGALVWFLRDLWPGAGWGLVDSTGAPKAALWYLKRAWRPCSIHLTDDGLDGLGIHATNEGAEPIDAAIELTMLQSGRLATARAQSVVRIPARGAITLQGDAMLGYFSDSTNAYRFGPPKHDVIAVRMTLRDTGELLGEDFHFPAGMSLPLQRDIAIDAGAEQLPGGSVAVRLASPVFLQAVSVSCDGFTPDDNYFHLLPRQTKRIVFSPLAPGGPSFQADFQALNSGDLLVVRA